MVGVVANACISGFASASFDLVLDRLATITTNEAKKVLSVDTTLEKLETGMKKARNLLNKVDYIEGDNGLQRRAERMVRFCYDAQDLIENLEREIRRHKSESRSRYPVYRSVVRSAGNWFKPHKIHELHKQLDELTDDFTKYLDLSQDQVLSTSLTSCDVFIPPNNQQKLIGRDEDISAIVEKLICLEEGDSNGVSIVGMRGLGKTALAHFVLNQKEVRETFPLILQAPSCGDNFNYTDVLAKLKVVYDKNDLAHNGYPPSDLLTHDRWLILIEDLWEVSQMVWRSFQVSHVAKGRKLLITTVNPEVAEVTNTATYYLKPLSDEHCRDLIADELDLMPNVCSNMTHMRDTLAAKSAGLPLVAIFLARNSGEVDHQDFRSLPEFRKDILPILKSTLPMHKPDLARCFVYFSLFPLDYHFDMEELIQLWIGEGLVQLDAARWEQNGRKCFRGLLKRSLLQPLSASANGLIRYTMHAFNHYFAQVAGLKTYIRWCEGALSSGSCNANTCHLSLSHKTEPQFWDEVGKLDGLRTFLFLYDNQVGQIGEIPGNAFKKISRLRVLVLRNTDITKLPDSMKELRELRYLDISKTLVQNLPETLSNLRMLQIIKLKNGGGIPQLPRNFCHLTNLALVDWERPHLRKLQSKLCSVGNLINLRTLPLFAVGDKEGHRISELKNMKYIQGSICITNLEMVQDGEEAQEAMLWKKSAIQRLELEWSIAKNDTSVGDVLTALQPHGNLKELMIKNYGYEIFPQWLSRSLPMLETLELEGCHCNYLLALGQVPALKTLHIQEMNCLRNLDRYFCGASTIDTVGYFPKLESLVLDGMLELQSWTGLEANDMPCLRKLEIINCPELQNLPPLNNLTSLVDLKIECCQALCSLPDLPASLASLTITEISVALKDRCTASNEDWLKIDHVPKVYIDDLQVQTSAANNNNPSPNPGAQTPSLKGFQSTLVGGMSRFGQMFKGLT